MELFSILVFSVLAILAVKFLLYYFTAVVPKRRQLDKIPAQFPAFPILGASVYLKDGPEFRKQIHEVCLKEYPDEGIIVLWIALQSFVAVYKAEYVEAILASHEIKKSYLYEFTKPWLGEGLLTSFGDKWYHHRKLLTNSFHFRILNDFVPVMNEHAEELVDKLASNIGKGEVDIFPLVTMATLDVICEAAMGQATGEEDKKARAKVFQAIIDLSHCIQQRQKKPQLWPDFIFKMTQVGREHEKNLDIIDKYTEKIFTERLALFDKKSVEQLMTSDQTDGCKRRPLPFLDSCLYSCDDFKQLSQQDIKDEVKTFLFTVSPFQLISWKQ